MYAFGVLLWEMLAGCRAWASMKHAQVRACLLGSRLRMQLPCHVCAGMRHLHASCDSVPPRPRFC